MKNLAYYDSSFNSKFTSVDIINFGKIELALICILLIVFL